VEEVQDREPNTNFLNSVHDSIIFSLLQPALCDFSLTLSELEYNINGS
jgi:hypothetical protein